MEFTKDSEVILIMTEVYYDEYGDPVFYASAGDGEPAPAILHTSHEEVTALTAARYRVMAIEELMDTIEKFKEAMKKPVLHVSDFKKVP